MAEKLNKKAIARTAQLMGDRWAIPIVAELMEGKKRFGELRESVAGINPQMLSARLKRLEEAEFVVREAYAEVPPRVEYSLTEKGNGLLNILRAISDFGEQYADDV